MATVRNVWVQAAVVAGLALGANQAHAICTFGGSGEPSLQATLNTLLSGSAPNVVTQCLNDGSDAGWQTIASSAEIQISVELAGNAGSNEFGVYDLNTGTTSRIFEGLDGTGATATVRFGWHVPSNSWRVRSQEQGESGWDILSLSTSAFGFYLRSTAQSTNFYSQTSRNTDGLDHMFAYQGNNSVFASGEFAGELFLPSDYIIAWDDTLAPGGDRDYQDFVAVLRDFTPFPAPSPVPLPTAIWLLGSGLIGLAGVARRRA